jgi:hypothetical protein
MTLENIESLYTKYYEEETNENDCYEPYTTLYSTIVEHIQYGGYYFLNDVIDLFPPIMRHIAKNEEWLDQWVSEGVGVHVNNHWEQVLIDYEAIKTLQPAMKEISF